MNALGNGLDFVFMRPLWLLGLLVLPALPWAWQRWQGSSRWESYIAAEKLRYLSIEGGTARSWPAWLVPACLALALLALAGPSWRSVPLPVKQSRQAMVIAFDLSPSMLAQDLAPDRLTRARLKLIDWLRLREEGETALIAYADDAYRVSPLTDDASTIEVLVPSLHPSVMPGAGSNVEAAVTMARELLEGAGLDRGDLLIITDGIERDAFAEIGETLDGSIRLCILGVGTEEAVPIPLATGGFARDDKGQTILVGLDREALSDLAGRHGGCFAELRADDGDLERLGRSLALGIDDELDETEEIFDLRQDEGHWLVLFLLPFAALAFRRNLLWAWLLAWPLSSSLPSAGHALEWSDLWQRPDQQAFRRVEEGIARYREGDYPGAVDYFEGDSLVEHYNRGNAQAFAGDLEAALASYDRALELDPDHEDARFNRDLVEELLKSQPQQQQEGQQQGEPGQDPKDREGQSPRESDPDASKSPRSGESADDSSRQDSTSEASPPASPSESESDPPEDSQASSEPSPAREDEQDREGQQAPAEPGAEEDDGDEREEAARPIDPEQAPLSERSEQWLRNIPEDPGGLMRRKFQYEAELRRRREARGGRPRTATRY